MACIIAIALCAQRYQDYPQPTDQVGAANVVLVPARRIRTGLCEQRHRWLALCIRWHSWRRDGDEAGDWDLMRPPLAQCSLQLRVSGAGWFRGRRTACADSLDSG
jgi:hypothetical protein